MATTSKILLSLKHPGLFHTRDVSEEAAAAASACLQENHEQHHIYFNSVGFHNHIVHQLLTLFALGATPDQIRYQYKYNKSYQRNALSVNKKVVSDLHNPEKFGKYLGNEKHYQDYMTFFKEEMDAKGYDAVIQEYLMKGDARSDDMLVRMHTGLIHPIIHLGFGVEFEQPAIIAEALAQAAIHPNNFAKFFYETEKKASTKWPPKEQSLSSLLSAIHTDARLRNAAHWSDDQKIQDGILARAGDSMMQYASQWRVPVSNDTTDDTILQLKLAQLINATAFFTLASQHPSHTKNPKLDFFYIHSLNSNIFYPTFLSQLPSLTTAQKARLLEWKGRMDLLVYASRGAPELFAEEVRDYRPSVLASKDKEREKTNGHTPHTTTDISNENPEISDNDEWLNLIRRANAVPDDGHLTKALRALAHAATIFPVRSDDSQRSNGITADNKFQHVDTDAAAEDDEPLPMKPEMWLPAAQLTLDSVDNDRNEPSWVRSTGFEEAWRDIGERKTEKNGERRSEKI